MCRLQASIERSSQEYGFPFTFVLSFNYLGILRTASGYDWTSVVGSLQKNQNKMGVDVTDPGKGRRKCAGVGNIV